MRVFVTGATSSLVQVMLKNIIGIDLVKINSLTNSYSDTMIFNLDALKDFERGDFILHAAWNMKKRNIQQSRKINIKGTVDFFESLNVEQQNSFIFISSVGAIDGTKSVYGSHKLDIENYILPKGGRVIRLGVLFDELADNLIFLKDLKRTTRYLPFIPNFSGKNKIYFITELKHLNHYFNLLKNNSVPKFFNCHNEYPINFNKLVKNILKIDKLIIPFPISIAYMFIKIINKLIPSFPLSADSFEYIINMKKK